MTRLRSLDGASEMDDGERTLLIVDDDQLFGLAMAAEFRDRGYSVEWLDGLKAVERKPELDYHYAVIDLRLRPRQRPGPDQGSEGSLSRDDRRGTHGLRECRDFPRSHQAGRERLSHQARRYRFSWNVPCGAAEGKRRPRRGRAAETRRSEASRRKPRGGTTRRIARSSRQPAGWRFRPE